MKLTPQDVELFRALNNSVIGKHLADYLERLSVWLFNPETVTSENVNYRRDTIKTIKEHLVDRIKLTKPLENGSPDGYN